MGGVNYAQQQPPQPPQGVPGGVPPAPGGGYPYQYAYQMPPQGQQAGGMPPQGGPGGVGQPPPPPPPPPPPGQQQVYQQPPQPGQQQQGQPPPAPPAQQQVPYGQAKPPPPPPPPLPQRPVPPGSPQQPPYAYQQQPPQQAYDPASYYQQHQPQQQVPPQPPPPHHPAPQEPKPAAFVEDDELKHDDYDEVHLHEGGAGGEGGKGEGIHEDSLIEEWETQMQNFVPEMLVTFQLAGRSDEYFYEEVGEKPVLIRGGYFVSADEDQADVEFQITDPAGDVIYHKSQAEGLFYFETKMAGVYSFIVSNHRWVESKLVTFAVGMGNDTALQPTHLNPMEDHLSTIDRQLRDIQAESTYLWVRQRSHMKAVEGTKQRVLWFAAVQFIVLMGVSAFQVYYIKSLLSDRRIL
ncbi:unnamed protein product [Vitrella brassicaformis CCMP3155]|uniref:GOLD domain-containing protein n=1 Tax=Vitrella brassicaformis (strain CCMP3155) TaxID=1169540 RepID=A0A0G4GT95_VITBC|nr:unnamed protein product [Vitrella brassicaformis CCMP3155]|eukprot:CEM33699.1 unnamed protein product [Vitrella brassicaformis CCMP3155]